MSNAPVVVVGASAGGVEALRAVAAGFPPDLEAAVLVVLHIPRTGTSALWRILTRAGALPARPASDGEVLKPGWIYVAPTDHHLLAIDGRARLSRGPAENGHRPAVDPLFRSAARSLGSRAVAVVLSGSRDDGTAGAASVAARGGQVLVQDPDDALFPSMPRSVLDHVPGARAHPVAKLGSAIADAVSTARGRPEPGTAGREDLATLETAMANLEDLTTEELSGQPAGLACPSCHGALFELPGEPQPRFRCWVGHAWSPESLIDEQGAAFEGALWMALRSLEEKGALARRLNVTAEQRGAPSAAERFRQLADEAQNAARLIRELIGGLDTVG